MIVAKDKVVSLTYELRLDETNGDVLESLNADAPLTFLFGGGGLLPKFEENIDGMKIGDSFSFELKSADAYGSINPDALVNIPTTAFEVDGKIDEKLLHVGANIPMQDASGNKLTGVVKEINAEDVKMDFNHPLAGNDLFFKGEITDIREASEEELQHGHVHNGDSCGSGGCDSCGCDSSEGCC